MYYLEKNIELNTGAIANCWIITDKKEILYRYQAPVDDDGNPVETINPNNWIQKGVIILSGYKDVNSWLAGKLPLSKSETVYLDNIEDYKQITLESLSEYGNIYNACQAVCLQAITGTDKFSGSVIKNSDDA